MMIEDYAAVMPGHSRPEGRRALHAYVPGIHILRAATIKSWMAPEVGLARLPYKYYLPKVGYIKLAVTSPAMTD
jgi:hypothetical protein